MVYVSNQHLVFCSVAWSSGGAFCIWQLTIVEEIKHIVVHRKIDQIQVE